VTGGLGTITSPSLSGSGKIAQIVIHPDTNIAKRCSNSVIEDTNVDVEMILYPSFWKVGRLRVGSPDQIFKK
jgi:hypothetical protein